MKMQGLNDRVFYVVTYLWQLFLYTVFVVIFVASGSVIGLTTLTKNAWSVQVRFAILIIRFNHAVVVAKSSSIEKAQKELKRCFCLSKTLAPCISCFAPTANI